MIQILRRCCQPGIYIDNFLSDSDRFIRNCSHVIEQHPLRLYCSAIAFAPHESVIRRGFRKEMSAWIVKPPAVADAWSACTQTLEGHEDRVHLVVIAPDGCWLASASFDKTVKIWSVAMGICIQTLEGHSNRVISLAKSPNGRWLISGSEDRTIKIWDVAIGACEQTFEEAHERRVQSIVISLDGDWFASTSSV
ncbi:WD40-repeat-containing domain protein [Xylaria bambusicola]|uniref:WD40-repeat-containing domain protein n=1 Tax=Xylaria bambusicola TaxID=326684 RepID=UPI002007BFF1|nr:WD40-repeat-containing domain protein [Xylaria bambusicola]KAI0515087.1 WD40-repeat-containing domain protein [Xylaria bambusicola]